MESQHTIDNKGLSSLPVDMNICGSMANKTTATDIELKDHVASDNESTLLSPSIPTVPPNFVLPTCQSAVQYPIWIKAFETLTEIKTKQPSERLYYLGKYTSAEAKEAVSGLLPLDTETAYAKAKNTLANRFGIPFLASSAYRKKLESWPKIASNDDTGLRRYSDFLQHSCTAMDKINFLSVFDDLEENRKMLNKLPNYLVNRWARVVDNRIGEDVNERSDDEDEVGIPQMTKGKNYPSFKEFSQFVKKEARIACNPVISQCFLKEG